MNVYENKTSNRGWASVACLMLNNHDLDKQNYEKKEDQKVSRFFLQGGKNGTDHETGVSIGRIANVTIECKRVFSGDDHLENA